MAQKGLSARRLSLKIEDTKESYIGSLLNNRRRPRIDMIYAIAEALEMPVIDLITSGEQTTEPPIDDLTYRDNLSEVMRRTVSLQPPYHYIHEIWATAGGSLDDMKEILPYIDIFSAINKKPWLVSEHVGSYTLAACMIGSTETEKYQHEIETALVPTMKAASKLYRELFVSKTVDVGMRSIKGTILDGRVHDLTYIAHIFPCTNANNDPRAVSFTTPIAYHVNRKRVL